MTWPQYRRELGCIICKDRKGWASSIWPVRSEGLIGCLSILSVWPKASLDWRPVLMEFVPGYNCQICHLPWCDFERTLYGSESSVFVGITGKIFQQGIDTGYYLLTTCRTCLLSRHRDSACMGTKAWAISTWLRCQTRLDGILAETWNVLKIFMFAWAKNNSA